MNADFVYHFTDTMRLPWILQSGELRAGANKLGGFPHPDFVWATTDPVGDRSASGGQKGYREGHVRLVRFTLRADDFEPWREIVKRLPAWTPAEVARLERQRISSDPQRWHCRVEPLEGSHWIAIHTRSSRIKTWRPLVDRTLVVVPDTEGCGVLIAGKVYFSQQRAGPNGETIYLAMTPALQEEFTVVETLGAERTS